MFNKFKDSIIFYVSPYLLKITNSFLLNYIYVDTLSRELVLQQKVEPNRNYYVSDDYSYWQLYCHPNITVDFFKLMEQGLADISPPVIISYNEDIYMNTGINYYNLVELYQKNICVID